MRDPICDHPIKLAKSMVAMVGKFRQHSFDNTVGSLSDRFQSRSLVPLSAMLGKVLDAGAAAPL
eukprot:1914903-Amphidinium_carterae.1